VWAEERLDGKTSVGAPAQHAVIASTAKHAALKSDG
jgi:hypothetical protein